MLDCTCIVIWEDNYKKADAKVRFVHVHVMASPGDRPGVPNGSRDFSRHIQLRVPLAFLVFFSVTEDHRKQKTPYTTA